METLKGWATAIAAAIGLLGLAIHAVLRWIYAEYYWSFALQPEDVGLGQQELLLQSAFGFSQLVLYTALIVTFLAVVMVGFLLLILVLQTVYLVTIGWFFYRLTILYDRTVPQSNIAETIGTPTTPPMVRESFRRLWASDPIATILFFLAVPWFANPDGSWFGLVRSSISSTLGGFKILWRVATPRLIAVAGVTLLVTITTVVSIDLEQQAGEHASAVRESGAPIYQSLTSVSLLGWQPGISVPTLSLRAIPVACAHLDGAETEICNDSTGLLLLGGDENWTYVYRHDTGETIRLANDGLLLKLTTPQDTTD